MSEAIAIGVDAGGSSTVAAVSRDGIYESSATGGPANATSRGAAAAATEIAGVIRAVAGDRIPGALFVAAAGAGRPEARKALAAAIRAAFPRTAQVVVEDDTRAALRAGLPGGPGAVVIAGTGSVAYAENGDLRALVGGAGYMLGDEGSAYALGLGAVKLLLRAYDGRAPFDETAAFAGRALGVSDRAMLLHSVYGAPFEVARIAALAPAIVAFAGKGNRAATKLVQTAAADLGDLVRAAVKAAALLDVSPTIVFAGGLLRENSLLSFLLETRVTNDIAGCAIVRARDEPARAALRFAEALL